MSDKKPRCQKCGRPLKSALSIARGLGPICAGANGGGRSVTRHRARRGGGGRQLSYWTGGHVEPLPTQAPELEEERKVIPWEIQLDQIKKEE